MSAINLQEVNPIVALAGAAANTGCPMFAQQLLTAEQGEQCAFAILTANPRWAGMSALTVARVVADRLSYTNFNRSANY